MSQSTDKIQSLSSSFWAQLDILLVFTFWFFSISNVFMSMCCRME